ncbi:unnamed protein product [Closterium sp. NIES-54]
MDGMIGDYVKVSQQDDNSIEDLINHLRTSDTRYRAALPAEFLDKNPPPMYITHYFIVTRLPDSLCVVSDHFLALDPTDLIVDLLDKHLLAAKTSVVTVGAARGTPRTPFFKGCSPSPLAPSYASAAAVDMLGIRMSGLLLILVGSAVATRARVARVVAVAAGVVVVEAVEAVEVAEVVAAVGVVAGVGASVAAVVAAVGVGVAVVAVVGVVAAAVVAVGVELFRGEALAVARGSSRSVGARPLRPSSFAWGHAKKFHTQHRCFSRLDDAWRAEFGDEAERPRWLELLRFGVDIFALDYDAILAAMYALSVTAEGDCYLCVLPDPGIEAAALGASESALPGTAPAKAMHTFTLDSGASRCFFSRQMRWSLPPLLRGQRVSISTCTWTGRHLATFTRRPGSSLYTLTTEPPQVAASAQVSASGPVAAPCSCRLLSHQTLLWHHRLDHPSLPRLHGMHSRLFVSGLPTSLPPLPPCLPCVEGRQRAAPHSSSFPPTTAPPQTLHMDVKGEVPDVLIPSIRAVHLQLRERFCEDLLVLRLHSDKGGEFSSDLLREFCRGEGILQSFTLLASPQQNGVAERRIGLVMEVARTSMIHAADPHFLWPFAGSRVFVRDTSADKLSSLSILGVFLGFPPDAPGWQFYHPTSRRVLPSQDVTFERDPAPLGVSQVDPLPLADSVGVIVDSGAARGAASGGAEPGSAEPGGAEAEGAEPGGAESEGGEFGGAEPRGTPSAGGPAGASPRLSHWREPGVCFAKPPSTARGMHGAQGFGRTSS